MSEKCDHVLVLQAVLLLLPLTCNSAEFHNEDFSRGHLEGGGQNKTGDQDLEGSGQLKDQYKVCNMDKTTISIQLYIFLVPQNRLIVKGNL